MFTLQLNIFTRNNIHKRKKALCQLINIILREKLTDSITFKNVVGVMERMRQLKLIVYSVSNQFLVYFLINLTTGSYIKSSIAIKQKS